MLTPHSGKALGLGLLLSLCTIVGFSPASGYAQSALAQQAPPDTSSAASTKPAAKPAAAPSSNAAKPSASKSQATSPAAKSAPSTAARKSKKPAKPAVFLEQNQPAKTQANAAATQSKPKQTELAADFEKSCPDVSLTEDKTKARYAVAFEREPGSKGVKTAFGLTNTVHKTNRIEVRTRAGKELFSETGHSTAQLVKDACSAIAAPTATLAKN